MRLYASIHDLYLKCSYVMPDFLCHLKDKLIVGGYGKSADYCSENQTFFLVIQNMLSYNVQFSGLPIIRKVL